MKVRFTIGVLSLISINLLITVHTASNLCPANMTYHRDSHSCLILIKEKKYYEHAKKDCSTKFPGGHLVHIFDRETDDFVKRMLPNEFETAYIGLRDQVNGVYKWDDGINATYFGWSYGAQTPSGSFSYVIISTDGWEESANNYVKYFCQMSSASKAIFFVNTSTLNEELVEVDDHTKNLFSCQVFSNTSHHLELLFETEDGQTETLKTLKDVQISHNMMLQCNSSGRYVCRITDTGTKDVIQLKGYIKVKCRALYCSDQSLVFVAPTEGADINVTLCVYVSPRMTSMLLLQEDMQPVDVTRYNISFTYSNNITTRGEIRFYMFDIKFVEYGKYFIQMSYPDRQTSSLYFNIKGPPPCPENMTAAVLDSDMVQLAWLLEDNPSSELKFAIYRVEKGDSVYLATLSSSRDGGYSFNVSDLQVNTMYQFYLIVSSDHGSSTCSRTNVTLSDEVNDQDTEGTTDAQEIEATKNSYVVPVVVTLVLLIAGVLVGVFIVRRRRKNKFKSLTTKDHNRSENKVLFERQSSTTSHYINVVMNTADNLSSGTEQMSESHYSNGVETKIQQKVKMVKPPRKSTSSLKIKEKVSAVNETEAIKESENPTASQEDKTMSRLCTETDDVNIYINAPSKSERNVIKQIDITVKPDNPPCNQPANSPANQPANSPGNDHCDIPDNTEILRHEVDTHISSNEKPVNTNERPISSSERPISSNERPISSNERPISSNERTISSSKRPINSSNDDSRTISPDGLIYVSVEAIPSSRKFSSKVKSADEKTELTLNQDICVHDKTTLLNNEQIMGGDLVDSENTVEYSTIDFVQKTLK
ncbi:lectin BRA-3 [Biomphalaria glabrata]|nr:lectin BRA-3-like [Biomphalaria glabrata]